MTVYERNFIVPSLSFVGEFIKRSLATAATSRPELMPGSTQTGYTSAGERTAEW
jgi:hypothetical protein